jgi:ribosomal protein S17E
VTDAGHLSWKSYGPANGGEFQVGDLKDYEANLFVTKAYGNLASKEIQNAVIGFCGTNIQQLKKTCSAVELSSLIDSHSKNGMLTPLIG